jgi:hypothetical protein
MVDTIERALLQMHVKIKATGLARPDFIKRLISRNYTLAFFGYSVSENPSDIIYTLFSQGSNLQFIRRSHRMSEREIRGFFEGGTNDYALLLFEMEAWRRSEIVPVIFQRALYLANDCIQLPSHNSHLAILDYGALHLKPGCLNQ